MSEMEQPSKKPDKKSGPKTEQSPSVPLTAEEGRLLAVEAIAKTRKDAEDLLGLNTDFAKAAIAKFDVPEDTIAQTVSSEPEQEGELIASRRRQRGGQEKKAATGRKTKASTRLDPLRMDVKTQTKLKDRWLEQLLAQCNGDPKLAAVAGELQALVGKNPEDSVLRALEEKLKTLTAPTSPDSMPASVLPIKRKVETREQGSQHTETGGMVNIAIGESAWYCWQGYPKDSAFSITRTDQDIYLDPISGIPYTKGEIEKLAKEEGWQRVETSDVTVVPPATMPAQVTTPKPEETPVKDTYTEAWLAAKFPRGKEQEFSLESMGGRVNWYRFDGEDFMKRKSRDTVASEDLVGLLNKGWKIEMKAPENDPQPVAAPTDGGKKPDTVPTPPVSSKKDNPNLTIPPEWELVPKEEGLRVILSDHEQVVYRTNDPKLPVVTIVREGDRYRYIGKDGAPKSYFSEREIQDLARAEQWTPVLKETKGVEPPIPASPDAPKPVERDMTEIEKLRILLDEARLEYVRTDYNQGKLWAKITGVINKLRGKERGDTDTQSAFERYKHILTSLMEAELAQLKSSGMTKEEVKVEMVRILNFYTAGEHMSGEKLNLKLARQQAEAEDKDKWAGTMVLEHVERIGKWYQKRSAKEKILLGGAGLIMGSTAVATAGTVTGLVAGGAFLTTKFLTSAAAGVTADGLMESCEARLEKWLEEKKREKSMEELEKANTPLTKFDAESVSPEVLEILSKRAQEQIDALDDRMQRKKLTKLFRKTLAVGIGVGLTAYFSYKTFFNGAAEAAAAAAQEHADKLEVAKRLGIKVPTDALPTPGAAAVAPELASSSPAGAASAAVSGESAALGRAIPLSPRELAYFQEVNGVDPVNHTSMTPGELAAFQEANSVSQGAPASVEAAAASAEVSSQVSALREAYPVTDFDGKRGLWGVIDERLKQMPGDMKLAERNRVIASIQNLMRQDLANMSPAERAAAGFAKGDLNLIHRGTMIHFDEFKSLTSERLQAIIDGQSVGAPSGAGTVPDIVSAAEKAEILKGFQDGPGSSIPDVVSPAEKAEILKGFQDGPGSSIPDAVSPAEKAGILKGFEDGPGAPKTEGVMRSSAVESVETGPKVEAARAAPSIPVPEALNLSTLTPDELLAARPGLAVFYEESQLRFNDVLFDTPENPGKIPVIVRIPGTIPEGAKIFNMGRVVEISQDFRTGQVDPAYWDRHSSPLPSYQVDRLAHLARVSAHPNVLGELGLVRDGETAAQYVRRIVATAVATGKVGVLAQHYRGIIN